MKMIKIAVCDDEPIMVQELFHYISRYMEENPSDVYKISSFFNGRSLLESDCDFDIIF